jgi:hypothetical protein
VAVPDQDPDLVGLLAAKDGIDRGLGLQIVDEVAKAWGVRQDGAGGKIVWCALDLPAPQAARSATAGSRRPRPAPPPTMARPTSGFIASFQGDNRHIADYLATEVLERQPEPIRQFLLQTSVLERLSARCATPCWRPKAPPSGWPSWNAPTCS